MIVSTTAALRTCAQCGQIFEAKSDRDRNRVCPACRSKVGRARQKRIQKAARKKRGAVRVSTAG